MPLSKLFHKNIPSNKFHNIIKHSSDFLNRKKDILILRHFLLVDRFRLISISGEAGIGKTATANRFANLIINSTTDFHSVVWTSAKEIEPKPPKQNSDIIWKFDRKALSERKGLYAADMQSLFKLIMNLSEGKDLPLKENTDKKKSSFFLSRKRTSNEKKVSENEVISRLKIRKTLIVIDDLDSWENWEELLTFARKIPYPSAILITTRKSLYGTIPGLASHKLNLLEKNYVTTIVERRVNRRNLNLSDNDIDTIVSFAKGNPLYAILATGFSKALKSNNPRTNLLQAFLKNDNYIRTSSDVFKDLYIHLTDTAKEVLLCLCALTREGKEVSIVNLCKVLKKNKKAISFGIYELDYSSLINRDLEDGNPHDVHDLIKEFVFKEDFNNTERLCKRIRSIL